MEQDIYLRKQQLVELDILTDVAAYCEKNRIQYSLCSGTLLGAIRHKGFIPWDDDIDICMQRTEYEKFLSKWESNPIDGYVLVNHKKYSSFNQTFTKICKNNTALIDRLSEIPTYHCGISIDIFPMDRIPEKIIQRLLYWYRCAKYHLFLHGYVPSNVNPVIKIISKIILLFSRDKEKMSRRLYDKITQYKNNKSFPLNFNDTNNTMMRCYPSDLFEKLVRVPFENQEFYSFEKWDQELSIEFGDYMKLPTEEKRTRPHKPEFIDFEHNYGEC